MKKKSVFLASVTLFSILVILLMVNISAIKKNKVCELAYAMYNYDPYNEIEQDSKIKKLVTNDMYKYITLYNSERQMYSYLKYQGQLSNIVILESNENYVVFYYDKGEIEESRTFRLECKFNNRLAIESISETEQYYLPPTTRSEWYY